MPAAKGEVVVVELPLKVPVVELLPDVAVFGVVPSAPGTVPAAAPALGCRLEPAGAAAPALGCTA